MQLMAAGERGVSGQCAVRHAVVDSELVVAPVTRRHPHPEDASVSAPNYSTAAVIEKTDQVLLNYRLSRTDIGNDTRYARVVTVQH